MNLILFYVFFVSMNTEQHETRSEYDTYIIIVECDEFQNSTINERNKRISIMRTFDGKSVYFIVWNPYEYKQMENHRQLTLNERYDIVDNFIYVISKGMYILPDEKKCYAIYLFYDYYNGIPNTTWKCFE